MTRLWFLFLGCVGSGQHYRRRAGPQGLRDPAWRGPAPPHLHQPRDTNLLS